MRFRLLHSINRITIMASQTKTGKAFEYAILFEFYEKLKAITRVSITDSEPYQD